MDENERAENEESHEDHSLEVEILSRDNSLREGHLILKERSAQQRIVRALQSLALWLVAAFIALFIPVLHFILVPVFVLAALFMASNAIFDVFKIESGEAICARCNFKNNIEEQNESYPLHVDCENCDSRITAYRASAGELT